MAPFLLCLVLVFLAPVAPKTYLVENFESPQSFSTRWKTSSAIPKPQQGSFQMVQNTLTSTEDHGLQTSESLRYYAISHPLTTDFPCGLSPGGVPGSPWTLAKHVCCTTLAPGSLQEASQCLPDVSPSFLEAPQLPGSVSETFCKALNTLKWCQKCAKII